MLRLDRTYRSKRGGHHEESRVPIRSVIVPFHLCDVTVNVRLWNDGAPAAAKENI